MSPLLFDSYLLCTGQWEGHTRGLLIMNGERRLAERRKTGGLDRPRPGSPYNGIRHGPRPLFKVQSPRRVRGHPERLSGLVALGGVDGV